MIGDTLQVTCDAWHMTLSVGWTFSKNLSSIALPFWDWQCLEDIWTKGWMIQWMNKWINDGGNCRTSGYSGSVNNYVFGIQSKYI